MAAAARSRLASHQGEPAAPKQPEAILELDSNMNPVTQYLSNRQARPQTMAHFARRIKRVQRMLVEVGHATEMGTVAPEAYPWHCLDVATARKFADLLQTRYPNVKSRHNLLGVLREVLRMCGSADLISVKDLDALLTALPLTGSYQRGRGRVLTEEDVARFLQRGLVSDPRTDQRDRTIITVFLSTGIRVSELVEIEVADLNLSPQARSVVIKRNKGGRRLTVYLNDFAVEMVKEWLEIRGDHPGALFDYLVRPGQRLATVTIQEMIIRRREKAGIETQYSTHDFRRTLATTALRQGVDVFSVQRLLGHTNVQSTLVYDRRTETEDRAAVDSLKIPGLTVPSTGGDQ